MRVVPDQRCRTGPRLRVRPACAGCAPPAAWQLLCPPQPLLWRRLRWRRCWTASRPPPALPRRPRRRHHPPRYTLHVADLALEHRSSDARPLALRSLRRCWRAWRTTPRPATPPRHHQGCRRLHSLHSVSTPPWRRAKHRTPLRSSPRPPAATTATTMMMTWRRRLLPRPTWRRARLAPHLLLLRLRPYRLRGCWRCRRRRSKTPPRWPGRRRLRQRSRVPPRRSRPTLCRCCRPRGDCRAPSCRPRCRRCRHRSCRRRAAHIAQQSKGASSRQTGCALKSPQTQLFRRRALALIDALGARLAAVEAAGAAAEAARRAARPAASPTPAASPAAHRAVDAARARLAAGAA